MKELKVFEAIIDEAASEYFSENTKDAEAVKEYAENGMNIYLSDAEAEFILGYLRDYQRQYEEGMIISSGDYYHDFEKPLSDANYTKSKGN